MRYIRGATALLISVFLVVMMSTTVAAQEDDDSVGDVLFLAIVFLLIILFLIITFYVSRVVIQPWQQGLKIVSGKYKGRLDPGSHWVPPFITKVIHVDLRETALSVPAQEVIFRDKTRGVVDAILHAQVVDPEMAFFQVTNWKLATVALAQTALRNVVSVLTLDELVDNKAVLNQDIIDKMHKDMAPWGVRVRLFDIDEMREN